MPPSALSCSAKRPSMALVVRSAGNAAAANFAFGLDLGIVAGVGWGLLTIFRMLGPWLDFSLASLASHTWRLFVFPIFVGSAMRLLTFIDSVLAFAIWKALERLRLAAKVASPFACERFCGLPSRQALSTRTPATSASLTP